MTLPQVYNNLKIIYDYEEGKTKSRPGAEQLVNDAIKRLEDEGIDVSGALRTMTKGPRGWIDM